MALVNTLDYILQRSLKIVLSTYNEDILLPWWTGLNDQVVEGEYRWDNGKLANGALMYGIYTLTHSKSILSVLPITCPFFFCVTMVLYIFWQANCPLANSDQNEIYSFYHSHHYEQSSHLTLYVIALLTRNTDKTVFVMGSLHCIYVCNNKTTARYL